MKKLILFTLIIVFFSTPIAFCQENDDVVGKQEADWRFILDKKTTESFRETYRGAYIMGVIDCVYRLDPDRMGKFYKGKTTGQIKEEVVKFYKDNPSQRRRPIVDVVLAGCK